MLKALQHKSKTAQLSPKAMLPYKKEIQNSMYLEEHENRIVWEEGLLDSDIYS